MLAQGKLITLQEMLSKDVRQVSDEKYVQMFYIQSASLVGFLIERHGSDSFIAFCRQLRDGKSFQEALVFSYPTSIRSVQQLEERWLEYIRKGV